MERFSTEQKAKRKKSNDVTNQRKRERELLAAKARASAPSRVHGGTVFQAGGTFLLGRNRATSKWA
jgi:hypothetical protein